MKTDLTDQLETFPGHSAWLEPNIENKAEWHGTRPPNPQREPDICLRKQQGLRFGDVSMSAVVAVIPLGDAPQPIDALPGGKVSGQDTNSFRR
jgi:hypothetical protein